MSDLNRLLDTLVADVNAGTRAPGAPMAIRQAHQRRLRIAPAVAAVVAAIAVAGGLAAEATLGGRDQLPPIGAPTQSPPESPKVRTTPEPPPISDETFREELKRTLAQVPGWTITKGDYTLLSACAGDWSSNASGWGGGSIDVQTNGEAGSVWSDRGGYPSAAAAANAVDRLVENLPSCTTGEWRTQPIKRSGAVMASSTTGVVWILQNGATVSTLQVPTSDGPPPHAVQVEVAALIHSWIE